MIHLNPAATNEIKRLKSKQSNPNLLFRLSVDQGGCAELYYIMGFTEQATAEDLIYECDGISIVINSQTLNYINGLTIDYSEDLMGGGFRFHNPIAIQTCGCGNSFSVGTTRSVDPHNHCQNQKI